MDNTYPITIMYGFRRIEVNRGNESFTVKVNLGQVRFTCGTVADTWQDAIIQVIDEMDICEIFN